jgi:hypothetical protein
VILLLFGSSVGGLLNDDDLSFSTVNLKLRCPH